MILQAGVSRLRSSICLTTVEDSYQTPAFSGPLPGHVRQSLRRDRHLRLSDASDESRYRIRSCGQFTDILMIELDDQVHFSLLFIPQAESPCMPQAEQSALDHSTVIHDEVSSFQLL